jgi:hypothetical protein
MCTQIFPNYFKISVAQDIQRFEKSYMMQLAHFIVNCFSKILMGCVQKFKPLCVY